MPSKTRRLLPALVLFVILGCCETALAGPVRVPNTQPYRVTAAATATWRTGSATMSARALIDRNHRGSLEIVAGDFQTRTVGTVTKFQLKSFDGNGDLLVHAPLDRGPAARTPLVASLAAVAWYDAANDAPKWQATP